MEITKKIVQQVLNDEDIEGLLELGAPEDEYCYEAEAISSRLRETEVNEDAATEIIRSVWSKAFGPFTELRSEAYRRTAQRILSLAA